MAATLLLRWMRLGVPIGLVVWSCLGCLLPDAGGCSTSDGSVWSLLVVEVSEDVELGLEFFEAGSSGLGLEPALQGLMEPFHFALGLGVVGTSMTVVDTHGGDRFGQADLVDLGVIGEKPFRPPIPVGGRGESVENRFPIDRFDRFQLGAETAAVVDHGDDLHHKTVAQLPFDVVDLPAFVGPFRRNRPVSMFGCFLRFRRDKPSTGENPPDRRLRGNVGAGWKLVVKESPDRRWPVIPAILTQLLA